MKMLTAGEVAALASMPKRTLQDWATDWEKHGTGSGPRPIRLGERITRYRIDEVAAWLNVEPDQLRVSA